MVFCIGGIDCQQARIAQIFAPLHGGQLRVCRLRNHFFGELNANVMVGQRDQGIGTRLIEIAGNFNNFTAPNTASASIAPTFR